MCEEIAAADHKSEVVEHIDRIQKVVAQHAEQGLCGVLIIRADNETLLHEAYGFADREAERPMTVETGFDIGSLVKPITAVAVLRLEQDGKLSLDDRLDKFFPKVPEEKSAITIDQLLKHQAAMPDIFGDDYNVVTRDWFLDKALNARLIGEPGNRTRYSNAGYSLLAVIIEEVTDQTYEAYVRDAVLTPAGTPEIGYTLPAWKNEQLAVGYRRDKRWGTPLDHPWAEDGPSWNIRGNGGMLATAKQMCDWYEALFDGRLISEEQLNTYYKFDAGRSKSTGSRALAHAGGNGVFNSFQVSLIDLDLHLTFFTSDSKHEAEQVYSDFSQEFIAIGKLRQ